MKIKWTTITEDKNTWPPDYITFACNNGQAYQRYGTSYISVGKDMKHYSFLQDFILLQWRTMPKPSKKKEKKSPWKSMNEFKPIRNKKYLLRNDYTMAIYVFFILLRIPEDFTEWMEIPE